MRQPPPMYKKKPVRIKYGTQTGTNPPTITLFSNRAKGVTPAYQRYLENCLRREEPLLGAPIRWNIRASGSLEKRMTDA